jgi:hypothetical protein
MEKEGARRDPQLEELVASCAALVEQTHRELEHITQTQVTFSLMGAVALVMFVYVAVYNGIYAAAFVLSGTSTVIMLILCAFSALDRRDVARVHANFQSHHARLVDALLVPPLP